MPYFDPVKNFAKVIVNGGYNSTATTITLMSGEGNKLPDPSTDGAFNLVWWNATDYSDPSDDPYREIVRVTAKSGDVLTITRGQENTTSQNHNISGKTYKMMLAFTEKTYTDLQKLVVFQDGTFVGQRPVLDFLNPFSVTDDSANNKLIIYPPSRFGGDGSDGDLVITSGTTTIDLGGAKIFVKNYRNLEISGTGQLTFTNPHNDGTLIIFRVKGDCKLTSTTNPIVDLRNLGGIGDNGTSFAGCFYRMMRGGRGIIGTGTIVGSYPFGDYGPIPGGGGASAVNNGSDYFVEFRLVSATGAHNVFGYRKEALAPFVISNAYIPLHFLPVPGAGGGRASQYDSSNSLVGTPGNGGRGGGGLLIEVGGNLTMGGGTINASGSNGTAGSGGAGHGGGGAGGSVLVLYNGTKTGTDLTFVVSGGLDGGGGTTHKGADGIGLILKNRWFL